MASQRSHVLTTFGPCSNLAGHRSRWVGVWFKRSLLRSITLPHHRENWPGENRLRPASTTHDEVHCEARRVVHPASTGPHSLGNLRTCPSGSSGSNGSNRLGRVGFFIASQTAQSIRLLHPLRLQPAPFQSGPCPLRPQNHSEPQGLNNAKIALATPWRYRERLSSCSARSGCAGPAPESDASSKTKLFSTIMLHANTSIGSARPEANQAVQATYAGQGVSHATQHSANIFYVSARGWQRAPRKEMLSNFTIHAYTIIVGHAGSTVREV